MSLRQGLAIGVAVAFGWSLFLIARAIVSKRRRQERGFLFSLVASVVYVITFADAIGIPRLRSVLQALPGSEVATADFVSPTAALWALAALYVIRFGVFVLLLVSRRLEEEIPEDEIELRERANDYIFPLLSYVTLVACSLSLVSGFYHGRWAAVTGLAFGFLYFIRHFLWWFRGVAKAIGTVFAVAWESVKTVLFALVDVVVAIEDWARGPTNRRAPLESFALGRRARIAEKSENKYRAQVAKYRAKFGVDVEQNGHATYAGSSATDEHSAPEHSAADYS
jgi:hypothetical protein